MYWWESQETVADAPEPNASKASFEWKSNWYPVFPEIDADKAVPHPFQVRLMNLVHGTYILTQLHCRDKYLVH